MPEFKGDRASLDTLRQMAGAGKAYALVGGKGTQASTVFGAFVITSVQETGTIFIAEGVARRTEFTLELSRVDDVRAEPDGGASDGDNGFIDDDDLWEWWLG